MINNEEYIKKTAVIIPALEPGENFIKLISGLKQAGFLNIIAVNDGSKQESDSIFAAAEAEYGCVILSHAVNLGKGRALKTAFNYILTQDIDCLGAVTADADGQHKAEDVVACAKALHQKPDMLIMGCRHFESENIPLRSKLGNLITRNVMKFLCDLDIPDTQTGLRAMSKDNMRIFLPLSGERYEFETSMLLEAHAREIDICKVPVEPIYTNGNSSSHFNPLIDSIRIYYLLLKFVLASACSFAIDITLFTLLIYLLKTVEPGSYIFISTIAARIVSSAFNYAINKSRVFSVNGDYGKTVAKYVILCIFLMVMSAVFVNQLHSFFQISETFIKMVVDTVLFLVSFKIQHKWVFMKKVTIAGEAL